MLKTILYVSVLLVLAGCGNTNGDNEQDQTVGTTTDNADIEQTDKNINEAEDTGYRFIDNSEYVENMTAVEDEIREQWESETYTIESPLVVVNLMK